MPVVQKGSNSASDDDTITYAPLIGSTFVLYVFYREHSGIYLFNFFGWMSCSQAQTRPAGHQEIPGLPGVIKKYYINKLMFLRKCSIMWAGQTKFPWPVWQASLTLVAVSYSCQVLNWILFIVFSICFVCLHSMGVTAEMLRPFLEGWTMKQIIEAKRLFSVDMKIFKEYSNCSKQKGFEICIHSVENSLMFINWTRFMWL